MKNKANIFISYSHEDEWWKDELLRYLEMPIQQGIMEVWTDRRIEPGLWEGQIVDAMEKTDFFLLLITPNFLASEYITTKEVTTAWRKYKEGNAKIIPVICDSCKWELYPVTYLEREWNDVLKREMFVWLGKFRPFPGDGRPIRNWENTEEAFLHIINLLLFELK